MSAKTRSIQRLATQAFGLLLELRAHHDAHHLLTRAVAFLELLAHEKEMDATPVMLSVRVLQLRKS